ncbi:MAG: diacylglycerol O-acyltransferase [Acidimicrobiales bacterium]|jgi:diacylglycerol O-acyltransferase
MHQLSPRETELLAAESKTNLGHASLLVELDNASAAPEERITFDRLRIRMEERVHLIPSFRRRLHRVPLNLDRPWWLEDPHFDLDYHLRHAGVPGDDDDDSFPSLVARLHERPLDRTRPLWEMYLIDRQGKNPSLFVKIHHVLVDGVTGLDVLSMLIDGIDVDDYDGPVRPDRVPDDRDLLIRAGWSMAKSPWRMAGVLGKGVEAIPVVGRLNVLGMLAPWTTPGGTVDLPSSDVPAPRVSFNRTLSPHRRVAFASLPVAKLKEIRRKHDVRFNDVVLALVAGALRHWLVIHDELPAGPLVALTPLLVDSLDEPLGTALVPLATHRHEPVQRLREIAAATNDLTADLEARPVEAIRSMYAAAPAVASLASMLMVRTGAFTRLLPPFNVFVVNVPGGEETASVNGVALVHQHPLTTLVDGAGLSISAMSHAGVVDFSFVADRDLVPDLIDLADRLEVELEILLDAEI